MSSDKVAMIVSLMEMHGLSVDDVSGSMAQDGSHAGRPTLAEHLDVAERLLTPNTRRGFGTHLRRLRNGFAPQCTCRCDACVDSFDRQRSCLEGCHNCDRFQFEGMGELELRDVYFSKEAVLPLCELAERHAAKKAMLENRVRAQRGLGRKPESGLAAREMCNWALRFAFRGPVEAGLLSKNPAQSVGKERASQRCGEP